MSFTALQALPVPKPFLPFLCRKAVLPFKPFKPFLC
jgi:hypothetical protein